MVRDTGPLQMREEQEANRRAMEEFWQRLAVCPPRPKPESAPWWRFGHQERKRQA
jgi:hypothetical protein